MPIKKWHKIHVFACQFCMIHIFSLTNCGQLQYSCMTIVKGVALLGLYNDLVILQNGSVINSRTILGMAGFNNFSSTPLRKNALNAHIKNLDMKSDFYKAKKGWIFVKIYFNPVYSSPSSTRPSKALFSESSTSDPSIGRGLLLAGGKIVCSSARSRVGLLIPGLTIFSFKKT